VLGQAPELTLRRATNEEGEDLPWVPMPLEEALREPEKRILLRR
jgi:hypothetical protein